MFSITKSLLLQKTKPLYPNRKRLLDLNLACKEFSHRVSVARAQFYSALFGSLSIKSYATMTVLSWFFFFCYAEPLPTDLSAQ